MLREEPHLLLISADDIGDEKIVRAVVIIVGCMTRHRARFFEDDLVSMEEPRNPD